MQCLRQLRDAIDPAANPKGMRWRGSSINRSTTRSPPPRVFDLPSTDELLVAAWVPTDLPDAFALTRFSLSSRANQTLVVWLNEKRGRETYGNVAVAGLSEILAFLVPDTAFMDMTWVDGEKRLSLYFIGDRSGDGALRERVRAAVNFWLGMIYEAKPASARDGVAACAADEANWTVVEVPVAMKDHAGACAVPREQALFDALAAHVAGSLAGKALTFEEGTKTLVAQTPQSSPYNGIELVAFPPRNKPGTRFWYTEVLTVRTATYPERKEAGIHVVVRSSMRNWGPPHGYDRKSSPSRSLDVFMPSPEAEPGYAGYRHTAFGFRALVTNMDDVIRRNATREVPGSWTSHQDKHVFDVVRRLAGGRGLEGASLADPAVDRDGLWVLPRLAPGNHDRYLAGGSGIGRPDRRDIAQSLDEPLRAAGLKRAPTMRRVRLTLPVGGPFEKAADEDLDVQRRRRREALNATLGVLGNGDGLDLLVLHIRDETPALVRKEVEELLGPPDAADGGLLSWADGLVLRLMPAPAGPLAQLLRKARLDDAETEGRTSQQIAEIRRLRQDQANEEGAAEMREHVAHVRGGRKAVACAILEMPANFKGDEHDPYVLARRELAAGRVLPQVVLHDEANPNDQKYRASVADWIRMLGVVPVSAGDEEGARRSRNRPDLAPAAMTVVQRNSQAAGGGARIATQAFPLAARVNGSVLECAAPGPDGNPEWKAYGLVALDILSGGNQRWARNQRDENVRLFENFFAEAVRDIDRRGDTLLVLDGDTMPKWIKNLQNGRLTFDDVGVGRLRADPAGLPRTRMVRVTTADQRLPMYYYLEETKWAQGLFRWGDAGRTAYGLKRKPPTMKTVGRTANVSRNAASGDNLAGDHDPRRLAAMDELTLVLAQPGDDPDAVLMFAHRLRTVHAQYAEDTKQPFPLHELRLLGKAVTA